MAKRTGLLLITLWITILALIFRVFYISFGNINHKVESTAGIRSVTQSLYNSKKVIYDRNLKLLAGNQPIYYLIINPRKFDLSKIDYISEITSVDKKYISDKLKFETPFVIKSYKMPQSVEGVVSVFGYSRYNENPVSQHILGYLDNDGIVGLSGIERAYNDFLSEYNSQVQFSYSKNALNGVMADIKIDGNQNNKTDDGVVLTIDKQMSVIAEKSLKENCKNGCVIVMNCNDGEIYVLSSTPEFDPNDVSEYKDSKNSELINNCLVNHTVGSVFKIIIAACAIQNNIDNFEFECMGGISVLDRVFSCQNGVHHGKQNIEKAFANSCNCYFIAIGQLLGYDKIIETAQLFGLDSSIKIANDLFSYSGSLPMNDGELSLANLSIGQGDLLLTPLSVARMTASVCNGGYLVNPSVYKGLYIDKDVINEPEYKYKSKIIDDNTAGKIKKMCIECVLNGTGKNAKPENGTAGGKTASSQTGRYYENGKEILNTYFTGFYPSDNPEYVITVFAQNGKSGSATCAPVFKDICNYIEQNH